MSVRPICPFSPLLCSSSFWRAPPQNAVRSGCSHFTFTIKTPARPPTSLSLGEVVSMLFFLLCWRLLVFRSRHFELHGFFLPCSCRPIFPFAGRFPSFFFADGISQPGLSEAQPVNGLFPKERSRLSRLDLCVLVRRQHLTIFASCFFVFPPGLNRLLVNSIKTLLPQRSVLQTAPFELFRQRFYPCAFFCPSVGFLISHLPPSACSLVFP